MPTQRIKLPDGTEYDVKLPEGEWSNEQIVTALQTKGVIPTGIDAMDRFAAGWMEDRTATESLMDYARSHVPFGGLSWGEDGLEYKSADEKYGPNFDSLTPEQRRQVLKQHRKEVVDSLNPKLKIEEERMKRAGEWDIAGGMGMVAKELLDPVTAVFGIGKGAKAAYQGIKGAARIGAAATEAAKGGAIVGGVYGASQHLADEGLPTNAKEALSMTADTGLAAGLGAIASGALVGGVVAVGVGRTAARESAQRAITEFNLSHPDRATRVADQYEALVTDGVLSGKQTTLAAREARQALQLTKGDVLKLAQTREGGKFKFPAAREKLSAVNERNAIKAAAYQQALTKYRARGMSALEASRAARQELNMSVSDIVTYKLAMPEGKFAVLSEQEAKQVMKAAKIVDNGGTTLANMPQTTFDKLVQPLYEAIYKYSPQMAHALRNMEFGIFRKSNLAHHSISEFNKFARKLNSSERQVVKLALRKGEFSSVENMFRNKFGEEGVRSFQIVKETLNAIADDLEAAGVKFNRTDNFFPSVVKDMEGLKKLLTDRKVDVEDLLRTAEAEKGNALNSAEINKIINRALAKQNKYNKAQAAQHRRMAVEDLDNEAMGFYEDFVTALDLYVRDSYSTIARRNFFGKHIKVGENGVENMNTSIHNYLAGQNIDDAGRRELSDLLRSRFVMGEMRGDQWLNNFRSITSAVTLGNPASAAMQLGDVGSAAWQYGLLNALKAIPRATADTLRGATGKTTKSGFTADDLGLMRDVIQELQTGGIASRGVRKFTDKAYSWGGFKLIDRWGKNVTMEAGIRQVRQSLKANPQKLMNELGEAGWSAEEIAHLVSDLKSGRSTDIVRQMAFSKLSDIQPTSKLEMPKQYLDNPGWGRTLYQFKTWGLKQLNLVRKNIISELMSKDPKRVANGLKNATLWASFAGTTQMGAAEVRNWMVGKDSAFSDPSKLPEQAFFTLMSTVGFNKWGLSRFANYGDPLALVGVGLPALGVPAKFGWDLGTGVGEALVNGQDFRHNTQLQKAFFQDTGIGRFLNTWLAPDTSLNNTAAYGQYAPKQRRPYIR